MEDPLKEDISLTTWCVRLVQGGAKELVLTPEDYQQLIYEIEGRRAYDLRFPRLSIGHSQIGTFLGVPMRIEEH